MRGLAIVAVVLAAAAVTPARAVADDAGIVNAEATVPPGPYLFGETVAPELNVLVNTTVVDPKALQISLRFFPYEQLAATQSVTSDGSIADIHYRYLLQCLSLQCITASALERTIRFAPAAVVRYRDRSGHVRSRRVPWPSFREVSRVGRNQIRPTTAAEATFAIPANPLSDFPTSVLAPPPSYRLSPLVLVLLLAVLAAGALFASLMVARPLLVLVRRRGDAAGPELSPLERALAAVEEAARRQTGGAEHREALGLLARELRRAQDPDLVRSARKLAWSEQAPSAAASRELVEEIRAAGGSA
jgi:hypothetical protein